MIACKANGAIFIYKRDQTGKFNHFKLELANGQAGDFNKLGGYGLEEEQSIQRQIGIIDNFPSNARFWNAFVFVASNGIIRAWELRYDNNCITPCQGQAKTMGLDYLNPVYHVATYRDSLVVSD